MSCSGHQKRSRSGEVVRASIAAKLVDAGGSAAARAEAARLRDVVSLSVRRAHVPKRISNKMLLSLEGKEEVVKAMARPAHGVILVPVEEALTAEVSFGEAAEAQPVERGAEEVKRREGSGRAGFGCATGCALHYETVRELAEALAQGGGGCTRGSERGE